MKQQKNKFKITTSMEKKYQPLFQKQARYMGGDIYTIPHTDLFSNSPRKLFEMFVEMNEGMLITAISK